MQGASDLVQYVEEQQDVPPKDIERRLVAELMHGDEKS
jgi:hypothetical protein